MQTKETLNLKHKRINKKNKFIDYGKSNFSR